MFMAVLKSNLFGVTFLFITFNGLCVVGGVADVLQIL